MRHVESTLTRSKAKAAPYFQGDVKMLPSQALSAGAGFQSFSSFALVANLGEHEGQDSNCFWVVHDLFHQQYVYSIHMYMYLYTCKKTIKKTNIYIYKNIHIYLQIQIHIYIQIRFIYIYTNLHIYTSIEIYIYTGRCTTYMKRYTQSPHHHHVVTYKCPNT